MLPREHYLKQTFQDTAHFPNGFEKGGLSDIQARLVRKNGHLINALVADEVSDPTPDDLHILKVIANQSAPKSPVEQAWVKYLNIVKAAASSSTAKKASKPKAAKPAEDVSEPVVEPKASKAKPATKAAAQTEEPKAEKAKPKAKATASKAVEEEAKPAKKTKAKA